MGSGASKDNKSAPATRKQNGSAPATSKQNGSAPAANKQNGSAPAAGGDGGGGGETAGAGGDQDRPQTVPEEEKPKVHNITPWSTVASAAAAVAVV